MQPPLPTRNYYFNGKILNAVDIVVHPYPICCV